MDRFADRRRVIAIITVSPLESGRGGQGSYTTNNNAESLQAVDHPITPYRIGESPAWAGLAIPATFQYYSQRSRQRFRSYTADNSRITATLLNNPQACQNDQPYKNRD